MAPKVVVANIARPSRGSSRVSAPTPDEHDAERREQEPRAARQGLHRVAERDDDREDDAERPVARHSPPRSAAGRPPDPGENDHDRDEQQDPEPAQPQRDEQGRHEDRGAPGAIAEHAVSDRSGESGARTRPAPVEVGRPEVRPQGLAS